MTPRRILFVDDDRAVLEGLENMLRKQRHVWEMTFAQGGPAAILELERAQFDVVVSDMKMPGIDGPALLQIVQERYPATSRIVLSGQADRAAVLRTLPVTHQFLSKPCDPDVLRGVIDRTCNLQDLLRSDVLRAVVGGLDTLPSSGESYWALSRSLRRQDAGAAEITEIVERDPAMAAKVLQLVNSSYFGLRHSVSSIFDAIRYLGVELLTGLLLTSKVFAQFDCRCAPGFSIDELQEHSLNAVRACRLLQTDPAVKEEMFAASLLHDIGQLVLAVGVPTRFGNVLKIARETGRPLYEVEIEEFGVSHAEVGAYLLGVWGLPFTVVEAVAFHHRPASVTAGSRNVLAVLHVADLLVDAPAVHPDDPVPGLDMAFLESGPWALLLPRWRALLSTEFKLGAEHAVRATPTTQHEAHG
jgi:HD-like signal output (HDOD) protein